jgi:transposase
MIKAAYFIGIDLHKTVVQVCVLNTRGDVSEEFRVRLGTEADGQEVIRRLTRWQPAGRFVVEALGLNRWFVNACQQAGLNILVADAAKLSMKRFGKKTDRHDARELARRLWVGDVDRYARSYYPSDEEYGVRKIIRVRHQMVAIRQQVGNQIRSLLNAYALPSPGTALYVASSLKTLMGMELPTADLTLCLQTLVATLRQLQDSIEQLTKQIRHRAKATPVQALEAQLPSVGPQTALTLQYELGDLRRFDNAKQICAYAGLVPRVANSGDTQHHGRLTKRGNPEVRWIVSEWAVRLLAFNPQARAWARPRLRRMHQNKVRMALARRLLVGVYVSQTRCEEFSLERCLAA